jgi:hypothetical protein
MSLIALSNTLTMGRVAQLVWRLTTGWMVWGSIPGGVNFLHLSKPAMGPTQPPVQWVPHLSWNKVWLGHAADPSPPHSARSWKRRAIPLPTLRAKPDLYRGYFT